MSKKTRLMPPGQNNRKPAGDAHQIPKKINPTLKPLPGSKAPRQPDQLPRSK